MYTHIHRAKLGWLSDHEISSKIVILVGGAAVLCGVVAFVYKTLSSSSIASMSEGATASDLPVCPNM